MSVAAVVLAAGPSHRFGSLKQLHRVEGEALVHRAARLALDAGLAPVVVVLGAGAAEVGAALGDLPVERVLNPEFALGQSRSIRAGLSALADAPAVLFLPCDMPFLRAATLRRLADTWRAHRPALLVPTYQGRRGAPSVVCRRLFPELAALEGDIGGRALWPGYAAELLELPIDDPREGEDLDLPPTRTNHL